MITTMTTTKIENGKRIKYTYTRCTECVWRESVDTNDPLSTAREHEATHHQHVELATAA